MISIWDFNNNLWLVVPFSSFKSWETNNHIVQSFSLGVSVKRISVLCFESFASFLDGEICVFYNVFYTSCLSFRNF
ncbi:hypothetical protein Avbf_03514 [Armadillidium vulgare]|nr:hypothetical protein Avbf_03514 [Armadillidium vulgare]